MLRNKKLIGVCLAKIEDEVRCSYINYLHKEAAANGHKIIVFNSPRDFYMGDVHDKGSRSIFESINYDVLDALVLMSHSMYDASVIEGIAAKAAEHGIPVITVHGRCDGCYNLVGTYEEAYKKVIRHVINDHGVKRPMFMGGLRDEIETVTRLKIFKDVLAENNIPFTDDMVCYGEYWDIPAKNQVEKLISSGKELPDAMICANDSMAVAVCEEFAAHGIRVPEDITVTGFDGLVSAEYFMPRLTTCREDLPTLAKTTMDLILKAEEGSIAPGDFEEEYSAYIGESCGCACEEKIDYRARARYLYSLTQEMRKHEQHIYSWVDTILESDNINSLSVALRDYILPNSGVCLRENFIMTALGKSPEKIKDKVYDELIVISSKAVDFTNGKQGRFLASDMVPDVDSWVEDNTLCVLTPIFEGGDVCGYYAVKTDDISDTAHKLFRVSKTMNISFGSLINRISNKKMRSTMQNARYIDSLTGLPNLMGLSKWFADFSADEVNRSGYTMVSVYFIPQYKYIYENYGIEDIEEAVRFVAESLMLANKDNGFVARTASDEFIVVNSVKSEEDVSVTVDNAVSVFFGVIEGYNKSSDKDYYLEVNCGCTVANPGWNSSLETFIKLADAEMYMNRLKAGMSPVVKDEKPASAPDEKDPREMYSEFMVLVNKNLFTYHFQPIIDARTGDIYAYEALMRSSGGIKMSPVEILRVAKEYNMLYDIEKATMFNVMEQYVQHRDTFGKAMVFINTIPGSFLNDEDISELRRRYGKYMHSFVFEITEQDTVSDEELNAIRLIGADETSDGHTGEGKVAVDDYGTGHSNIVNLLRYTPHIIKIDRFLITNIQNDPNKQMFVKSTIEFAKMNNIKVLAEGVETYEEMKTVIEYGIDLIQGFYTAKPAPEPLKAIPEKILREIIDENITASRYDNELLAYNAADGEIIDLYAIALEKYGMIHINGGRVTLEGTKDHPVTIPITTADDSNCMIRFDNVCLKAGETPALCLGKNSNVELKLEGYNTLVNDGILVPDQSTLRITGDGDLNIQMKRNGAVGIGNNYMGMYGNISFEHTGNISIVSTIDKAVGIGGGVPCEKNVISFISGNVDVFVQCVNSICIGSVRDKAAVSIGDLAYVKVKSSGKEAVGIGSMDGKVTFDSSGVLDIVSDGERSAAIGTINDSQTDITFTGGRASAVVHGDDAVCIGSISGNGTIKCLGGFVRAYGEGNRVTGIGSSEGKALTDISGGTVSVKILSGQIMPFGGHDTSAVITGGNILIDDPELISPVNAFGDELHSEKIDGDSFIGYISTGHGDYKYVAEKREDDPELTVYIP